MKNLNFLSLLLLTFLVQVSCSKDVITNETDCYQDKVILKTASNIKGRITILDAKHPDIWCIKSLQGVIGGQNPTYDTFDIIIPCQLPDDYKVQDLIVVFSGDMRDPGSDFKNEPNYLFYKNVYYSNLTRLTKEVKN